MKTCKQCSSPFEVAPEDLKFYEKVSPVFEGKKYLIPEPDLCPSCREQLRLAWKNERKLYKHNCDLCGKATFSLYSSDKPYKVYCVDCWWSDKWDPMEYGMEFDFSRPFFEQYNELLLRVPKQALHHNNNAENCEYTTSTTRNRNCYLISSSGYNEDCYYGIFMARNKNSVDVTHIMDSELCYECVDADKGYNLSWCQNTKDCSDSRFLYDCHGCRYCFFCTGLRNKEYYIRNKPYSKKQYEKEMAGIDFTSHKTVGAIEKDFAEFKKGQPRLYYDGQNNENVVASDYIFNSKNCAYCLDANNLEDCKYCGWYNDSKDCQDVYAFGYGNEKCYDSMQIGTHCQNILMCNSSWNNISDLIYCFACHTSQNLFSCDGLKYKKYCIFNKQYKEQDYRSLVSQIIGHMQKTGEWGHFPSARYSFFAYNEAMANDFYPLSKDEAKKRGWAWKEVIDELPKVEKTIPAAKLPDKTADIPDDVLNWALKCEATGRPFKLIAQELSYYRKHSLPVPRVHPDERHRQRFELRNPRHFWVRKCDSCGKAIQTSYSPDRPEKVYCEQCYLKEVY